MRIIYMVFILLLAQPRRANTRLVLGEEDCTFSGKGVPFMTYVNWPRVVTIAAVVCVIAFGVVLVSSCISVM